MDESKKKDRYEDAKKFVRYSDGAKMYSMGMTKFQEVAKDAKACYKIGQLVLVNTEILDKYLETFHITDSEFYKVNTLSGSVSAYRKEIVKPRFIRIDEVMALLDVTRDEAMDIALAAGARYQLAKIILVHKERLMKFMKHFARVPSSNKIVEKKFVRIGEASMTYSIGHHRFIEMARAAGAVYKIGTAKGNTILINLEIFDDYMEQFREPPTEMKHPLPNVKGD